MFSQSASSRNKRVFMKIQDSILGSGSLAIVLEINARVIYVSFQIYQISFCWKLGKQHVDISRIFQFPLSRSHMYLTLHLYNVYEGKKDAFKIICLPNLIYQYRWFEFFQTTLKLTYWFSEQQWRIIKTNAYDNGLSTNFY